MQRCYETANWVTGLPSIKSDVSFIASKTIKVFNVCFCAFPNRKFYSKYSSYRQLEDCEQMWSQSRQFCYARSRFVCVCSFIYALSIQHGNIHFSILFLPVAFLNLSPKLLPKSIFIHLCIFMRHQTEFFSSTM